MAFLPEKFRRAEEDTRPELPTDDIRPLVQEEGQVAVALNPACHDLAEEGLAGWPHDDWLFKPPPACMGDDGKLGAEPGDVLGLFAHVALRDEQRQVDVLGPGRLDPLIDLGLDALPEGVAVGTDDHGAPDGAILGELGLGQDVLVPLGEIFGLGCEDGLGHVTFPASC